MNNKSQIASGIGQIRSRAAQPLRGELAVQLPLRGFHLQKILFSKICTTSDLKKSTISHVLICTLSEARFKRMRIKICYGHQTNIPLTILPFHHPHNHGKHLYAPHSDCHQNSHRAGNHSSFIKVSYQ